MSWRQQAACKGANTSVFFPGRGDRLDEAKAYCDRCPVRPQCLDEAMALRSVPGQERLMGVWGGTSERERRRDRRGRAA
jgi:WhiB family redox-sensing transcriptional regulator